MKKEYDFSKAKKNPYIQALKQQVTIRLDSEIIMYFKKLSEDNDIPYGIAPAKPDHLASVCNP